MKLDRLIAKHHHLGRTAGLRAIADYIAGMTDRYALLEHGRVCGSDYATSAQPWLRH